ncbi:MAG: serine/threonine-protein kinase [Polyangiales bacterium]
MDTPSTLETLHARLTAANLPSDVDPRSRVDAVLSDELRTVLAHSQLGRMLHALQPLHVARTPPGSDPPLATVDGGLGGPDLVVRGRLGEGGMGVVELAEQRSLGREVALKRLREKPEHEAQGYGLLDEARIHGSLEHPNVAPVHAVGADPQFGPTVVLKRVTGQTWSKAILADATRLPQEADALERHLRVLIQVCHALDYAHSRGVLHRDVKPENVMLGEFGEVYLMDWGLALRLESHTPGAELPIAGTPAYMAPEMVRGDGDAIDERTDVFLLGATLHEVLCGAPRHLAGSMSETMLRALQADVVVYGDEVPGELGAIANRACAAEPSLRYPNVRSFREAVEGFLSLRETHALVASAEALLAAADGHDPRPLYQAQFVLAEALRARPGLPVARRALTRCQALLFQHALELGELRRAAALLDELGHDATAAQHEALTAARKARESERARITALERDADPRLAQAVRLRAMWVACALITGTQLAQLWADPSPGFGGSPMNLLYPFLAATFLMAGYLASRARDLAFTAVDRQFRQVMAGLLVSLLVSRVAGVLGGQDVPTILARDTFVFSAVLTVLRVPLRGTFALGVVGLGLGLASLVWPALARYLHMALVELVVLGAAVDLTLEARHFARTPAPPSTSERPPR